MSLACSLANTKTPGKKLVVAERPALVLLAPANQNQYLVGTMVNFHAQARDIEQGVARIEITINLPGDPVTLIANAETPEGQPTLEAILPWQAVGNQTYLVEAQAFRADGTGSNLVQVSITVVNPNPSSQQDLSDTSVPTATTDDGSFPSPDASSASDLVSPQATEETAPPINLGSDLPVAATGTIILQSVPIRQGPSPAFPTVMNLSQGQTVNIVGRSIDNLWFVVKLEQGYGFIFQASVQGEVNLDTLPVVDSPPLPQ
jgi:hypothetical protein